MFRGCVSVAVSSGLYTALCTNVCRRHVSVPPGIYTIPSTNVFRRHVSVTVSPGLYTILPANMVRRHVSVWPGLYALLPANVVRKYVSVSPGLCPPGRVWDSSLHPPVVESSEPSQTTPATQNMKYPHIDHGQTVKTSVKVMTWVSWHHVTLVTWVIWRHVTLVTWVIWRHVTLMTWVSWRRAQCFLTIGKFCDRNCSFLRNNNYFGTYCVKLIDQNVYVSHPNLQSTIMYYKITKCWIPEQFVPEECK